MFNFLRQVRNDFRAAGVGHDIGEELVETGLDNVGPSTIGNIARDCGVDYDDPRMKRIVDESAFHGWNNGLRD